MGDNGSTCDDENPEDSSKGRGTLEPHNGVLNSSAVFGIDEVTGKLVGTPEIFLDDSSLSRRRSNLLVTPAPVQINAHIPTPSVFLDARGEIHNVRVGRGERGKRINLLHSHAGVLRSGDIHSNTQCDFLFEGTMEVWCLGSNGETTVTTYGPKSLIQIPPGVPHLFHSITDTVMAEWWENPQDFQAWHYKPYRQLVEQNIRTFASAASNKIQPKGKLVVFVEEQQQHLSSIPFWGQTPKSAVGGVSIGLSLLSGFCVGLCVGMRKR